jgi:hypothetical protein
MSWVFLDEKLSTGLTLVPLVALRPDRDTYRVMFHQHGGAIYADHNSVRNDDQVLASRKFQSLFQLGMLKNPHIMTAPEYSCPWGTIETLLSSANWPQLGAMWILGCESVTPDELNAIQGRNPNCEWVLSAYQNDPDRVFLDPVCILLNAKNAEGHNVRVVAVQFKCYPMADAQHMIEPNFMLRGSERFILRNDDNSIQLVTLLCSDCLEPRVLTDLPSYNHLPYLLLHLQLCASPCQTDFVAFKVELGRFDLKNFVVGSLNWAAGSRIGELALLKSGSSWLERHYPLVSEKIDIDGCHAKGLYFTWSSSTRWHCYLQGYSEHVIIFDCVKHCQSMDDAVVRRAPRCPTPMSYCCWDNATSNWRDEHPDDGFATQCTAVHQDMVPISDPTMLPLMRERLACLTAGHIMQRGGQKWHDIGCLKSLVLDREETCNRVTFAHDPNPESREMRLNRLNAIRTIKHEVLKGICPMPTAYNSLRTGGDVRYPAATGMLNLNVAMPTGEFAAAFVYVGERSEAIANELARDLTVPLSEDRYKLLVWYRDNGDLHYIMPATEPTIDSDPMATDVSIDREVPT